MSTILIVAAAAFAFAVVFFGWQATTGWLGRRAEDLGGVLEDEWSRLEYKFRAEWTDADEYVARANRIWPALQTNPFFWGGVATSTMICFLGIVGAWALAAGVAWLAVLYMAAFVVANLLQAFIAVTGDKGSGEWYEFKRTDRPVWQWPVLIVLLLVNFVASVTGSANVTAVLNTSSEIQADGLSGKRAALKRAEDDLDALRTRRQQEAPGYSAEALQAKATETEEAASREAGRGGCGAKCEAIKRNAVKWRALANDAVRERKLGDRVAVLRAQLGDMAASGVKDEAAPHARFIEEASGGAVGEQQVKTYLGPIFWLAFAVVDIALWLWAGDAAGRQQAREYRIRAEKANAWLENAGMKPRYNVEPVADVKALPAPAEPSAASGDTVNITVGEDFRSKIAASPRLQEIDALFKSVLKPADGSKITFAALYDVFSKLKQESGHKTWMNSADFRTALTTYCEGLGIEVLSSQVMGYKLGLASVQEAAE